MCVVFTAYQDQVNVSRPDDPVDYVYAGVKGCEKRCEKGCEKGQEETIQTTKEKRVKERGIHTISITIERLYDNRLEIMRNAEYESHDQSRRKAKRKRWGKLAKGGSFVNAKSDKCCVGFNTHSIKWGPES